MTIAIDAAPTVDSAARVPGPPELLPGRPDAVVDLQTADGAALVGGQWRYADARVEEIDFVELAGPRRARPARPRHRSESHLRRRAACAGGRLRRLGLAATGAG